MSVAVSVDVPVVLSRNSDATADGGPVRPEASEAAGAAAGALATGAGCVDFFLLLATVFFFGWADVSTVTGGNGVEAAGGAGVGAAGSAVCAFAVAEAKTVPTAKHAATQIQVRT